jgi:hypothetical protein
MIQNLLMLLAPESTAVYPAVQATFHTPPAKSSRSEKGTDSPFRRRINSLKFVGSVAGNAIGFAGLMASCWLSLQLLQAYLSL